MQGQEPRKSKADQELVWADPWEQTELELDWRKPDLILSSDDQLDLVAEVLDTLGYHRK